MLYSVLKLILMVFLFYFSSGSVHAYSGRYSDDLSAREVGDVVLNARELLDDLGMHARAFKSAALSARRMESLEERMLDLELELEALITRDNKDQVDKNGGKTKGGDVVNKPDGKKGK
jgi:hypothetical protein